MLNDPPNELWTSKSGNQERLEFNHVRLDDFLRLLKSAFPKDLSSKFHPQHLKQHPVFLKVSFLQSTVHCMFN